MLVYGENQFYAVPMVISVFIRILSLLIVDVTVGGISHVFYDLASVLYRLPVDRLDRRPVYPIEYSVVVGCRRRIHLDTSASSFQHDNSRT
jgi:hypothetical protein